MQTNPKPSYDDAVFRTVLLRYAQWGCVTRADMLAAFWVASPELLQALRTKGGDAMVAAAEAKIRSDVLEGLDWQLRELGLRLREEQPA